MPVKFNIVERANPSNREAPKKYYPSIQSSGRVTTREMAEMAADRSTLTTADMMAAIAEPFFEMAAIISEEGISIMKLALLSPFEGVKNAASAL